jgi:hypothetical protein
MEKMPGNRREQADKDPNKSLGEFAVPLAVRMATAERPPGTVLDVPNRDEKISEEIEGYGENGAPPSGTQTGVPPATDTVNPAISDHAISTGSDNHLPDRDIPTLAPSTPDELSPQPDRDTPTLVPSTPDELSPPMLPNPKDYKQILASLKEKQSSNAPDQGKQDELKGRYGSSEPDQPSQDAGDDDENTSP